MSLTIAQARDDLLSKLGIEVAASASALALQDVATALNGAQQTLFTAGEDFFTWEERTIVLSAGTASYAIALGTQAVIGPVRWNDVKPLAALQSQGELDEFARIFRGDDAYGPGDPGEPIAYFVACQRVGNVGDIATMTIEVAPTPSAPAGFISVGVVNEPPAYAAADLSGTTVLPVANQYVESILLPVARFLITRSSQFSRPDLLAQLTTDYERAMQRLGLAGGFPPVDQPTAPRAVKG